MATNNNDSEHVSTPLGGADEDLDIDFFEDEITRTEGANEDSPGDTSLTADSDDIADDIEIDLFHYSNDDLEEFYHSIEEKPNNTGESLPAAGDQADNSGDRSATNDFFLSVTNEEFGAPDQYASEYDLISRTSGTGDANLMDGEETTSAASRATSPPEDRNSPGSRSTKAPLQWSVTGITAATLIPVLVYFGVNLNREQSGSGDDGIAPASKEMTAAGEDLDTARTLTRAIEQPKPIEQPDPIDITVPEVPAIANQLTEQTDAIQEQNKSSEPRAINYPTESVAGTEMIVADKTLDAEANQATESGSKTMSQLNANNQSSATLLTEEAEITEETEETEELDESNTLFQTVLQQEATTDLTIAENTASDQVIGGELSEEAQFGNRSYHIIVASFATESRAREHANSISDAEITAYVIPPFGNSANYRVSVASYSSMAQAQENLQGLQAAFGGEAWPLRYPPASPVRVVSEPTGATYIIVASFPTEDPAIEFARNLTTDGEQPVIIAPYLPSNRHRVAIANFESLSNAEESLSRYKRVYGEDVWLLRY